MSMGSVVCMLDNIEPRDSAELLASLQAYGLQKIGGTGKEEAVGLGALQRKLTDLLVIGIDQRLEVAMNMVTTLRYGGAHNRFMPVLAVTSKAEPGAVAAMLEAGVDGVLSRPFDRKHMEVHLDRLRTERRPFTVTRNYVGPVRDGEETETITVPNSLMLRSQGQKLTISTMRSLEAEAVNSVREAMLRSNAQHIREMVKTIFWYVGRYDLYEKFDQALVQLLHAAKTSNGQIKESQFSFIAQLYVSLARLTKTIIYNLYTNRVKELKLIDEVSVAINQAFSGDPETIKASADIASAISKFSTTPRAIIMESDPEQEVFSVDKSLTELRDQQRDEQDDGAAGDDDQEADAQIEDEAPAS